MTHNTETLQATSQNEPNKNTKLLHREKLEKTPFEIIGNEEGGYFVAMGKYRLTEPQKTIPLAIQVLEDRRWEIIGAMITTTIVMMDNINSRLEEELKNTPHKTWEERIKEVITDPETLDNTVKYDFRDGGHII